jgi:uncharacterized protein Yka (UPF0111/DUF47 family)
MAKKRSQQDATIRNVRASKRRDESITARIKRLEEKADGIERTLRELLHGIRSALARI